MQLMLYVQMHPCYTQNVKKISSFYFCFITKGNTMSHGIDEDSKRKIIAVISALIPEATIYLFGSRARGTQSQWSDIDIALDAGKKLSRYDIGEIVSMFQASSMPY